MIKRYSLILSVILLGFSIKAQNERLSFEVFYNWGIIWINGGRVILASSPDTLNNTAVLRIEGIGKSASKWRWLFELDDHYTSWCYPETYLPLKSLKNTLEGGYFIHNQYDFNYKDSLVYIRTETSRKPLTFDTLSITGKLFDAQAATTYLRFMDFDSKAAGDTLIINILMDGIVHKQQIVYLGRQSLKDRYNNHYPTYKFTAVVTDNKLFSSKDAINVWISDDDKRIPIYIQANITVGSIKVFYQGIKLEQE